MTGCGIIQLIVLVTRSAKVPGDGNIHLPSKVLGTVCTAEKQFFHSVVLLGMNISRSGNGNSTVIAVLSQNRLSFSSKIETVVIVDKLSVIYGIGGFVFGSLGAVYNSVTVLIVRLDSVKSDSIEKVVEATSLRFRAVFRC